MISNLHATKPIPPTKDTAASFGSSEKLELLSGGQGTSYRSGMIILKPADDFERTQWMAKIFTDLPSNENVRFARPIKSSNGEWICDGYVAWGFLEGNSVRGGYEEKLFASSVFHELLKDIPRPDFLETVSSSWSAADAVVWARREFHYDDEFMELLHQITPHLKPIQAPLQLIHGDLLGNFLLSESLPTAIIDFSPAWAPNGFAEGVMLADALAWENASPEELEVFRTIPNIDQFAWRGVFRRIAEQAEHIQWLNKDRDRAVKDALVFQKAIDYLQRFSS